MLPEATYDTTYVPKRKLDIIVSLYSEDRHQLNKELKKILAIPAISAAEPNIIVYTKHPNADTNQIATDVGLPSASNVKRLLNRGREGGTYLSHIISHWDDLAEHTIFLQGEVHNSRYLNQRLADYYMPEATGFLSLGFSGKMCTLSDCTDAWGWHDSYGHLASTYSLLYGGETAPSEAITLTYKGQFVASARRIRAVPKHVYESLSDILESEESPHSHRHPENYYPDEDPAGNDWTVDLKEDNLDAPRFGYTLERMWGLLFQCAAGEMAIRCPSLHTPRGALPLDTCQCLDEI